MELTQAKYEYTPEAIEQKMKQLAEPFPKESIGSLPKGGTKLSYVGHATVTDRLNRIDPHWGWEPFALDDNGLPVLEYAANGNPVGLWIKFTCLGKTIPAYGDAMTGKSIKELIGDAIRNGAMRFGVALELWSKDELESTVLSKDLQPVPRGKSKPVADSAAQVGGDSVNETELNLFAHLVKQANALGIDTSKAVLTPNDSAEKAQKYIGILRNKIDAKKAEGGPDKAFRVGELQTVMGEKWGLPVEDYMTPVNSWLMDNGYEPVEELKDIDDGLLVIIKTKVLAGEITKE